MKISNKKQPILVALAAAIVLSFSVQAQYVGPDESLKKGATVATILANPVDDQMVEIKGKILKKIAHEKYLFSDGSAEIVAEIDDDDFRVGPIDESVTVLIRGEVDTGLTRAPEIEVKSIRIVE